MSEFDEVRAYEKGYADGVHDAQSEVFAAVRKDLKAAEQLAVALWRILESLSQHIAARKA